MRKSDAVVPWSEFGMLVRFEGRDRVEMISSFRLLKHVASEYALPPIPHAGEHEQAAQLALGENVCNEEEVISSQR